MHLFAAWCKTAYRPGACHIFCPSNFTYIYIYIYYTQICQRMQCRIIIHPQAAACFCSNHIHFWRLSVYSAPCTAASGGDMVNFSAVCVKKSTDFLAAFPCKGVVGTGWLFRPPPAACGGLRGLRPRVSASPKRAAGGAVPCTRQRAGRRITAPSGR